MYAHRQIYESIQSVINVPPELQHRKTEVIFVVLEDEPVNQPQKEGLGTLAARLFSQVGLDDDAEFKLPEREHYPPVSFDE